MYLIGNEGGMSETQKKRLICEALDTVTPDVLELLYRITFHTESGLE